MKTSRTVNQLVSVFVLLLWGGVMLYFYGSGRLLKGHYVGNSGWFTTMVLLGGLGCVIVGLFNLFTLGSKAAAVGAHDHDHSRDHEHDHHHLEGSHEHSHEGHDHSHSHVDASPDSQAQSGILEESGFAGRLMAIFVLAAPIAYASVKSPDGFQSVQTLENKGAYTQTYSKDAMAGKYELKKSSDVSAAKAPAATPATAPAIQNSSPAVTSASPATATASTGSSSSTPPAAPVGPAPSGAGAVAANPPAPAAQTKSYGTFTLADLKSQVPQSKEGNFMLEVPEIYYTAGDKEVQNVLKGQPVETVAQVIPEKVNNEKGTRVRVFRLLIQCCAADARPYSVPVDFGQAPPKVKDMTWVKVVGKMDFQQQGGQIVPVILATSMTETTEPDNKMVY